MKLRLASTLTLLALTTVPLTALRADEKATPTPAPAAKAKDAKDAEKDKDKPKDPFSADTFEGLAFRGIGPAVVSGRVADIAVVEPASPLKTYYVAVASGGVWKTTNGGTTFTPIFDDQPSYSIGCVTVDPKDPLTVWVGSGENNSQRSVSWGDGVYRSGDGGKSWENLGLKTSEHISRILIDPRDSKIVYVAAQGPLWKEGGERGLFKTTDGGKTWKPSLTISENTGVTDVWFDPRNADVLYAAAYQRRRHVFTLINGGPESGIQKSTDAGATWKKLEKGLPKADKGRIGLAVSPARPDTVYAVIEAKEEKDRGFYRSTNGGGSWDRMGDQVSTSPQYYNEIIPDPKNPDRVYAVDTFLMVTEDGGKTWKRAGEKNKHVDNHVVWIDPADTDHLLVGCDGGLYETWDRCASWSYKPNLPVTQFYRVALDNDVPYRVYGGTQDNFSLGGPSRTLNGRGIANEDWFVTKGGDGFVTRVDPDDPNIVYSEAQHGDLVRFDRKTGEGVSIQPFPAKGEDGLRWNWDSPLIISPHKSTRLYFAAQRIFKSDDRGNSWTPVSADLTAQIDRNKLKVMGRVQSIDAVAKNASTSFYGNIVSLTESPKQEGLIYAGTDDGLVQVTEDGGKSWRKESRFPGVPESTYVSVLTASQHDASTVYAAFDNHKRGDFKPYAFVSKDRGRSWTSIAGDLPARDTVYAIAEDFQKPDLLFAGTEYGVYFSVDRGRKWVRLKGGLPTIAVRDIAIQKRESDLVLATFGRGFYVLDDYSPLRRVSPDSLGKEFELMPARTAGLYMPAQPHGDNGKGFFGDAFYLAPNPPDGAIFTYYLKDEVKTRKARRREEEKKLFEKSQDVAYPTWEDVKSEVREEDPAILLTVSDADGNVIRRVSGPVKKGIHRVAWDLRYPAPNPTSLEKKRDDDDNPPRGPLVAPGTYRVSVSKRVEGKETPLAEAQAFTVEPRRVQPLTPEERAETLAFAQKTARLQRAVLGAVEAVKETQKRVDHLKKALLDAPKADAAMSAELRAIDQRLKDISEELSGGTVKERYNEATPPSIGGLANAAVEAHWTTTGPPTATNRAAYSLAADQLTETLARLTTLVEKDLRSLEDRADRAGAPWTPGRLPRWTKE